MTRVKGVHLKVIDFFPLPEHTSLEAYWRVFHNENSLEELPNSEIDEFLIELDPTDLIKVEVFADDDNVFIGCWTFSLSFFQNAKPLKTYSQIVPLGESEENQILSSDDFMKNFEEEPNLKIEFITYHTLELDFKFKKLSYAQDSQSYKIFGNLITQERQSKPSIAGRSIEGKPKSKEKKHVKFLDFKANPSK